MPKGDNKRRYSQEIVDNLPEMFANGESIVEVCVELGISRRAFYDWVEKYPEFKEAVELGKEASEAWWTKLGRAGAAGSVPINSGPWIFTMKNRFDWRDKSDHLLGGGDTPVKTDSKWTVEFVNATPESK